MDFRLGAFLIISAQICTTLALPPCVCGRNLQPVCGTDGTTYANKCLLDCASATMAKSGPCEPVPPEEQPCICTYIYKPVCATDGQTYPNECSMDCQKRRYNPTLSVKHDGACEQETTPKEPACVCPFLYSPVCGSDGKTYDNDCALNCATKDNSRLSIEHRGSCSNDVKVVN